MWSALKPWLIPMDRLQEKIGSAFCDRYKAYRMKESATGKQMYPLNRGDYDGYMPQWGDFPYCARTLSTPGIRAPFLCSTPTRFFFPECKMFEINRSHVLKLKMARDSTRVIARLPKRLRIVGQTGQVLGDSKGLVTVAAAGDGSQGATFFPGEALTLDAASAKPLLLKLFRDGQLVDAVPR
jgi:hypothetical protein